jgi:hypothetical protein
MKARLATVLSLAGVLVAGSAAALANTQVLDSGEPASGASAAVLPDAQPIDLTIPPSTTPRTTTTITSTTTTPSTSVASTDAPATSEFLTTFNVGSAGSVTLDVVAGRLRLVEAVPGAGWLVATSEEHGDDNEVEVEFRAAESAVEFDAELVDGAIVPHVSSRALDDGATASGTAGPAPAAPVPSFATDDDHEDREDGEHDEGEYEEWDDD